MLARLGLDVTVTDVSPVGLALAAEAARAESLELHTIQRDLETEGLPDGPWDVLLCHHFLHRPLYRSFAGALAPGGIAAVCHMTTTNLERNAHPQARWLLEPGELRGLLAGLDIVSYEEGWDDDGRHTARLVAARPGEQRS